MSTIARLLSLLSGRPDTRRPAADGNGSLHPDELQELITQTFEQGEISGEPAEMIRGVVGLFETTAAEVMTPRTDLIALQVDMPLDEAAAFILDQGHSRYPLYEESIDHIIGLVLARDVWKAQAKEEGATLRGIMRQPLFVPDTKPLATLLREMRRDRAHMAVVIDEFGGTEGIVTIEDVVEEIVGEIDDELDEAEPVMEEGPDGELLLSGGYSISELNDRFELDLPDEDYTTVGGFVLGRLGRVAEVGDEVAVRGGVIRVLEMQNRRIVRLSLALHEEPRLPGGSAADEDEDEEWE
ncbi:MAG TPA: hemolysin family protein [Longimicrobiales bacterium]|nr:hemolysin family protein [Longimicrobiales bacterium]